MIYPLLAVVICGFSFNSNSQVRLDTLIWQERFTTFLQEDLTNAYFSDKIFPENFSFNSSQNPVVEYEGLNFLLFPEPSSKLKEYYFFLEELNAEEKQKLVRTFSFFDDDIESVLKKEGLPTELKYLPPAISAMNFYAVGDMNRAGIWQLTHFQAVLNGAEIDKLIDERFHPVKSTHFAASQLKHDFEIYNDYNLAVAALVCGNTKVKNAIAEADENAGFHEIFELLPEYFQETVAAFQAMSVFLSKNKYEEDKDLALEKTDTINIHQQLHFNQVARINEITFLDLQFLNPQYKQAIIPATEKSQQLLLPRGTKNDFLTMLDSIYFTGDSALFQIAEQHIEYPPEPTRSFIGQAAKDIEIDGKTRLEYMLKTGDVLGIIAEKFDVSVSDLKYWNNIYNERRIQAGQKISVFVPDEKVDYYAGLAVSASQANKTTEKNRIDYSQIPAGSKKVEHVVKSGESPFVIAQKYNGVTPEAILQWNHIDNARKIQIGQKIILYIPK